MSEILKPCCLRGGEAFVVQGKRMKKYCLVVLMALAKMVWGQPPDTMWTRQIQGEFDISAYSVCALADGGSILVGSAADTIDGDLNGLAIRLNAQGHVIWERRYGGSDFDLFSDVTTTEDGEFLFVGYSYSIIPFHRLLYVVKTSSVGDTLWTRFGGDANNPAQALCIASSATDLWIAGYYENINGQHLFGIRMDADGDTLWTRVYERDSLLRPKDVAADMTTVQNNGAILVGNRSDRPQFPNFRKYDAYVVRVSDIGDTLWTRTIGLPDDNEAATAVSAIGSDGWIVAGSVFHQGGDNDLILLCRLDINGEVLWTREFDYGFLGSYATGVYGEPSGQFVLTGGAYVSGPTGSVDQPFIARFDAQGDSIWKRMYPVPQQPSACTGSARYSDGSYLLVGVTRSLVYPFTESIWLIRTGSDLTSINPLIIRSHILLTNYPNPFNASTNISFSLSHASPVSLTIFNVLGQAVYQADLGRLNAGEHRHWFDAADLPSGIYLARVSTGGVAQMRKMVLLK